MKEIVVISGKGGTGKTTIAAGFASLADNSVIADCDVDASNLHLITTPEVDNNEIFKGSKVAVKEPGCIECGKCLDVCRFGSVDEDFNIKELSCEGCGACVYICPVDVLKLEEVETGVVYQSKTRFGPMVHANLNIGEEASGKLVTKVKELARNKSEEINSDFLIVDGSPGIGCPVIASISGADLVVIVTEPTLSGIHDLKRVHEMTEHFDVPCCVVVNKYDINEENTQDIKEYCDEKGLELAAKIPYDSIVTDAMVAEKSVIEYDSSEVSERIVGLWKKLTELLEE